MTKITLKKLLDQPEIICVPGAYDAWSAKLIEMSGFPAVYMTGYGASASALGKPDIGLLTMTEMAKLVSNMAESVSVPVIADADNGYGSVNNVIRTVQTYEKAGASAIQLEDQVLPKRCGHMTGKKVIERKDMEAKIRAAVDARKSEDTLIIARTDARAVIGFDDALERASAYAAAGADVIFLEAPESIEEMKIVPKIINKPTLINLIDHGKTPFCTNKELEEMGYSIAIYPVASLYAITKTLKDFFAYFKKEGSTKGYPMIDFPKFNEMIGLPEIRDHESKFL
ncbi:carboxyvinyl-carboxyphosphonate phosphorylmutase [Francisella halioticida]|uniref:Carboxyvinyl-carboxyphosphonate phosphorylmutase n=1 Tax=Francisella halioticida TaxID=549298 RepID=A0ABM6LZ62_9GAMM|nr:isocitrate lyase/PEP mutase family protein [Francisella halioticida]ASG67989.1 carboxyvinyl-carboxyphosphonate phosphorylmutase [Francisella halioticida]